MNQDAERSVSVVATLTVRNRVTKTLACVGELSRQLEQFPGSSIIVVDDDSTDGTRGELRRHFPAVSVVSADGNQYWVGGMKMAEQVALTNDPDFVLWVNDDATICHDAIRRLVTTFEHSGTGRAIVCGAMAWPGSERASYTGMRLWRKWGLMRLVPVTPSSVALSVDAANGNLVLIPTSLLKELGGLDTAFTHKFGDFDFTLRATESGAEVILAPGFLGTTPRNSNRGTYLDVTITRRGRIAHLRSVKGFPFGEKARYLRRHGGALWWLQLVGTHFRYVLQALAPGARSDCGG